MKRSISAILLLSTALLTTGTLAADGTETSDEGAKTLETLKALLVRSFKDPDSAKFRYLQIYKSYAVINGDKMDTGMHALCGEVNATNSYGGYVGYKPFYIISLKGPSGQRMDPDAVSNIYESGDSGFEKLFKQFCREGGEFHMRTK